MKVDESINSHYGFGGISDLILQKLEEAGADLNSLEVDDLAPIDEFHTRGREGTLELCELARLSASEQMLDVGCGLGGSARHIASRYSCRVTGIDLTQEYIEVAEKLTSIVGLDDKIDFHQGSALELPFEAESFDVVWTEHVQMNIADKNRFYSELSRILKPGGRLVFHDIFRGASLEEPIYPLPWAEQSNISFLATVDEARAAIEQADLEISTWESKQAESIKFFEGVFEKVSQSGPPPIGIHLLMGETAPIKLKNYLTNLNGDRTDVVIGRAEKSAL